MMAFDSVIFLFWDQNFLWRSKCLTLDLNIPKGRLFDPEKYIDPVNYEKTT